MFPVGTLEACWPATIVYFSPATASNADMSLVDEPAIMTDYIMLSKEKMDKIHINLEKITDKKNKDGSK